MIRYPIAKDPDPTPERDLEVLCQLIEAEVPGWLKRAKRRTSKLQKLKRYDEKTAIWSEVKAVFAQLQHDKCAYCERKLRGASDDGKVEQDVEHFRPKSEVTTWSPKDTSGQSDRQETGVGYFLLAYAPQNYLISCKTCNSTLKATAATARSFAFLKRPLYCSHADRRKIASCATAATARSFAFLKRPLYCSHAARRKIASCATAATAPTGLEPDRETGLAALAAFKREVEAVAREDVGAERQADPLPVLAGGEEGRE